MDLSDSLDILIPVLFFIIWVIVGIAAKGKRRTKAGAPSVKPAAPRSRPAGGMGELRKTLQKVLEEMQVLPEQPEMQALPAEREIAETAMKETSAAVPEYALTAGESNVSLETTARRIPVSVSAPTVAHPTVRKIPLSEVRRGIVWSEVVQPPLALRE
ncbi:MAG: hypothetical protein JW913_13705 [Chitinispirillaceae bacterium]|nr:hypothetical protein [Chitinispirillaceae bacterium]